MEFRILGRTGVKVSPLCFGTMSFGGDADEETSAAMFHRCREAGINFFDCANMYQRGVAEEILGRLAKGCRDELVLTSKVYFPMGDDINARGGSRRHIMLSIEASLRRLQTEYLDIYFIHRFDDLTPLEETLRALEDLVRQGKILYPAVSNYAAWQVEKALGIAACNGWAPVEVLQPMYNLVKRQAEVEILPMAKAENLGVIPYSPLGGGLLSGKYTKESRPEKGRLIDNKMYSVRYGDQRVHQIAEDFSEFARANGYHPVSLAVAWVGSHPAVTAPIIGARNVEQLEDSLGALDIDMTAELRERVSSLSPAPAPATDRNEEKTAASINAR
ncbi:MAG TPA: aldo/keto reductase [Anaerolineaceae bacterium]|nr:aldo/keto reductase [Anaerolineaceae bacterium]